MLLKNTNSVSRGFEWKENLEYSRYQEDTPHLKTLMSKQACRA